MNTVIPFDFEGNAIRSTVIDDEPWFVATDLATTLEYRDAEKATQYLDEDEKGTLKEGTLGGNQNLMIINESGLYSLIFRSRKASAKRFKKWVTSEVLPAIRRTGRYDMSGQAEAVNTSGEWVPLVQHTVVLQQLLDCQQKITDFGDEWSASSLRQQAVETVRILFEETNLTDEDIARRMERMMHDAYMPEWVAWQRRKVAESSV